MDVWIVLKTSDRGSNGFEATVVGVYSNEKLAHKCMKLFASQIPMDLRDKINYNYVHQIVQENY